MIVSSKKTVQHFVSLLLQKQIHQVIITPGSRNAPFSISLGAHPVIDAISVVDERSAAFIALGMAQQWAKPVVLICTSGTAALNFAPAIAEAYYQRVPLLIVTADRPMEWIDQGEGQSIRQKDVFTNYVKASFEVNEEGEHPDIAWYNLRIMDEAMRLCTEGVHGPVHLNFPFREPLYLTVDIDLPAVKEVKRAHTEWSLSKQEIAELSNRVFTAQRVLVLAGQNPPDHDLLESLRNFAKNPNVAVITEAHSNLSDETFISTIDRLIMGFTEEQKQFFVPDILITFGHNIISRKVKDYIRKGQTEHWHIDVSGEALDTLKHLCKIIQLSPARFFENLNAGEHSPADSDYRHVLHQWNNTLKTRAKSFLLDAAWSDLTAITGIMSALPSGVDVQMGNSSVVRYILLDDSRSDLNYFGNRGVAGIDGCSSTAVGAAYASGKNTYLITGDIAFFYDSNAFWNKLTDGKLKIILINNQGGGIFRIIEGPGGTGDTLEKFFETTHERDARDFCTMYHLGYNTARNATELKKGIEWLTNANACSVLEVFTPRLENDKVLKAFFATLK